ncbi:MAG: helix-turn-helix transcriptional regulator [Clostridia bacterium]|nr:helix-turn-helix transcriptional regulator [Clostridia bacterium]MBQ3056049.1 helix-turn-helix transcriptional regulator [Clostridia bacterium]
MLNDLIIKNVVRAYYAKHLAWERNRFSPRGADAIVLFTEGKIEYHFEGKTLIAGKGDFLLLPADLPYSGKKLADKCAFFVLDFECAPRDAFEKFPTPAVVPAGDFEEAVRLFSDAINVWNEHRSNVSFKIKAIAYQLLCEVLKESTVQKNTVPVDVIVSYIAKNIGDSTLSVADLCRKFFISESQLRRNIQRATRLTPSEYILTLRLNRAKNELSYTDRSVKEIAARCGFASPYYFSRCFSEEMGMSPLAYRKNSRSM